jgi:hypothetical protein
MDVIYTYTRKQAIADGIQREISDVAKEEGFKFRTFMTERVWSKCVQVPEGVTGQDERGRLHDIFWMLQCVIRSMKTKDNLVSFEVLVRVNNRGHGLRKYRLLAQCGPVDIDDSEPSLTIMTPEDY